MLAIAVLVFMLHTHYRTRPRYYTRAQLEALKKAVAERDSLGTPDQVLKVDHSLLSGPQR